ncbi:MAG: threonine--tRNA ligase [bacterium]|nr:threonine--tRNA ligase [bacterium]MDZ4296330.1 threonine--tRNA ligase [Patescibacteria group bacterium]
MEKTNIDHVRHSLAHLLAMAVLKKFPGVKLGIGPIIENGFYYDFDFVPTRTKEMKSAGLPRSPHGSLAMTDKKAAARNDRMREPQLSDKDLPAIEEEMRRLVKENLVFEGKKVTSAEAKKIFKEQPYKLELINEFVREKKELTVYKTFSPENGIIASAQGAKQSRGRRAHDEIAASLPPVAPRNDDTKEDGGDMIEFVDLCKGGHVKNTSEINPDAFKLTHVAGAYWRANEKNPMLTRIYGVAFATKEELRKYLWQQEEAKKRDHRVLGERLKLFTFAPEVGPGLPLWLPHGTIIRDEIETYAKEVEKKWGYQRVTTPHIAKEELYRMSGHIPYYADDMFPPMQLDDGNYYLKAMNCPHTHMIYKAEPRSYRDLPIRYAEYGTVYRYELSGTLAGLLRTRGFTQNDAHIYCREDQVEEEFIKVMKLHEFWYKDVFGITDFYMRLSLPLAARGLTQKSNEKFAGAPAGWKKAVAIVQNAMKKSGLPYQEAEGEAAFYGPKVDFQIKSVIGREESASTNQLDFLATERFNLTYKDKDGKDKPVYVIHRAPLGAHERFIAFLIEHYAGAFPLWLSPVQVRILPIADRHLDYAKKTQERLEHEGIRVGMTTPQDTVGKRIRQGELDKIPYLLVIGDREVENDAVNVRPRQGEQRLEEVATLLKSLKDQLERRASP